MVQGENAVFPRMIVSVTRAEEQKKLEQIFDSLHIPICYQFRGQGTAPSEIMDIFGLRGTTRLIMIGVLPKFLVPEAFEEMRKQVSYHQRGGGIAVTIPVTGIQTPVLQALNEEARSAMEEKIEGDMEEMKEKSQHTMILVSVAVGYSDDVIDAARAAGAKGGTVINGRRRNSEHVSRHFGISLQEEHEMVMIIVPREKKADVMTAVSNSCGLKSEAQGVVLSVPVDDVMGLE